MSRLQVSFGNRSMHDGVVSLCSSQCAKGGTDFGRGPGIRNVRLYPLCARHVTTSIGCT
jgi:hypothetical protein